MFRMLALLSALALPLYVQAQAEPIRIGFLTVRTGPLAAGGKQMEEGIQLFLKERNNMIAGRRVELFIADTGGNPPQAKSKTQELVEKNIVPFDARKRGPEERAAMLEGLGFRQFVYDYRAEHIATFEAEMDALQRHN